MIHKFIGIIILCFSGLAFSQEYEQMQEQLNEIKVKMDKLNVWFNFQTEFNVEKTKIEEANTNFEGKMSRIEFRGNLNERLFYRMRFRLNKTAQRTSDGLSDAADIMSMGYRVNDKLLVSVGKMGQNWGGFEYDLTPMNIYDYSDFVYNIEAFLIGGLVYYKPNKNNELSLNIANLSTKSFNELYKKKEISLEESSLPFGYIFTWDGKFKEGKIHTRWSFGYAQQAKGYSSKMLILGNKFNFSKWNFFVDYSFAQEDLNKLGYGEVYVQNGVNSPKILKDIVYHSLVSRLEYIPHRQWVYSLQLGYEMADVRKGLTENILNAKRRGLAYFLGLEYKPFKTQNLSFYLTYVGRSYYYKFKEMNYFTHRYNVGIMYRMKLF